MAWVSPKIYAILKSSEEGKDILEGIAEKDQAEVDKEVDAFFSDGGKGYSSNADYQKAKDEDKQDQENSENEKVEDYSKSAKQGKNDTEKVEEKKKKLDDIVKEKNTFVKDKDYDAYSFKKELEENGHDVEYVENRSGTWKDNNGEKYKEYDIKLKNGQHIYFKLIADENYDTKEIITYKNGKNW